MRSKASYFSVSVPLIKENLRRFWSIPVLAFLVYFLSGVFPILMSYRTLNYMAGYVEMSLHNMQPFFMGAHLLVPVITAVLLFRYLQNVSSVAVMHSMPFTRARLYNSNFLSGLLLISAPIITNGIILLLLSKPTYRQIGGYGGEMSFSTVNVFARGEILNWMGTSLVIVVVLFSIAVFAAIVTGNNLMHLMTSYFFIFLIPLLYVVFNFYFQEFLYGFDHAGNWIEIALSISPYTGIIQGNGYFSGYELLFYLATVLLMLLVSAFLYNKRKLERASDSLTFGFMKPIICYIITFLGMTMLGFYFQVLGSGGDGRIYMYAGFAAGTVIFFIIGRMIVVKSPRIFNKEGLKNFAAYGLIAILFIVGMNADLTGFEKRVPGAEKVESVNFSMPYGNYRRDGGIEAGDLRSPENIKAIAAFHQDILDNRQRLEGDTTSTQSTGVRIRYNTKGLFDMSRYYVVDYELYSTSKELKTVFESAEYKSINSFYSDKIKKYSHVYIYSDISHGSNNEIVGEKLIEELIANMEKDFQVMTYEDFISPRPSYVTIELRYDYKDGKASTGWGNGQGYMSFSLPQSAKNTISWLKEHGYDFDLTADIVEWIDIYEAKHEDSNFESQTATKEMSVIDRDYSMKYGEKAVLMHITDKNQIEKVLKEYDSFPINFEKAYEVTIAYKPLADAPDYIGNEVNYTYGYINGSLDFLK